MHHKTAGPHVNLELTVKILVYFHTQLHLVKKEKMASNS